MTFSGATSTAFRQACRLGSISARAERYGVTAGRRRIARDAFARALVDLVHQEDTHGIDAIAWVADIVTSYRQLAMRAGVLTAEDVSRIESDVCAA